MTELTDLLPCPFCGVLTTAVLPQDLIAGMPQFSVMCLQCSAIGPLRSTEHGARLAWNVRAAAGEWQHPAAAAEYDATGGQGAAE